MTKRALSLFFLMALSVAPPAAAQRSGGDDWCRSERSGSSDRENYCEVRQFTVVAAGTMNVNAEPNGGIQVEYTDALSLQVDCEDQGEVDRLWEALSAGGEAVQCGWLKDRYGVRWQIVPTMLLKLLANPDPSKAQRVMQAMLQMVKLDIAALQRAYEGT